MNDILARLAIELPQLIESARDALEKGCASDETVQFKRGQIAAYREIFEKIKPPKRDLIGEPPAYGLSAGPPGY